MESIDITTTAEYVQLKAAKEARDNAYAALEVKTKEFLAEAPDAFYMTHVRLIRAAQAYELARMEVTTAEIGLEKAQAAFDTAYPPTTDVIAAIDAARVARANNAMAQDNLTASYSPEQVEMVKAVSDTQKELDKSVTAAKMLIEQTKVSAHKAFVVRNITKVSVSDEDMDKIEEAVLGGDLPPELAGVNKEKFEKWAIENPEDAEIWGVKISKSISVAFTASKL